ncbi:hypothetical protein [Psychromonas arctica]|uniref:hypothetical protein n=1 Tax=Psychromonas arctica TaxID=168275 RepID=UPI00040F055F|nr:hypothetical protein [Psychromonas arctica]
MLDAICILPKKDDVERDAQSIEDEIQTQTTFSIFEFKLLSDEKIALYRHSLFCPECLQNAYFRRASKDGKQACFGSRYHLPTCSALNSRPKISLPENDKDKTQSVTKHKHEGQQKLQQSSEFEDGFTIDFSSKFSAKIEPLRNQTTKSDSLKTTSIIKVESESGTEVETELEDIADLNLSSRKVVKKSIKQTLPKLLKSLLNNSSLATSDVWVYTSDKHKWRAKNLFVSLTKVEVLENFAPRMYWGAISHADKDLLWLNVAEAKDLAIPIKPFQQALLKKYAIQKSSDLIGANIILFAKCLSNKDKSRKFLQLWSNDLQYLHLSLKKLK